MGLRGPTPRPTALTLLAGNPGRRPLNKKEPQPRQIIPDCPAYLDEAAKLEWNRLAPILQQMRVVTDADGIALGMLCQAYATLIRAQSKLTETGLLFKTPSGYVQQSPLIGIVNSSTETITRLCREFGLTPAARTRVQVQDQEQKDEKDGVLDF